MDFTMKKQGFSSLYVVIILASLLFFILVVVEVTSGFAARSVSENICLLTGESLLSEYQKELFGKYGLFAMCSYDEKLTRMAEFYIKESLASEGADILEMRLTSCNVSSEKYPALDIKAFSKQIQAVCVAMMAKDFVSGSNFPDVLVDVKDAADTSESMKSSSEAQMKSLSESSQNNQDIQTEEEDGKEEQARKQAKNLWGRYKDVMQNQNQSISESKAIDEIVVRMSLPSYLLGIRQRGSILLGCPASDLHVDAWIENEYILNRCSYATAIKKNTYIALETEYILYGQFSDKENEEEIRHSLFWLRSALNIAHIYSDQQKKAEVTALAAGAFALIPLPVASFIISSIWAAVEAQNDLNLLFDGKCVPFFKTATDWKSSLSGAVNGNVSLSADSDASSKIGSYDDYLRLFLLAMPTSEKLVRLMDVIQLNIANQNGYNFCFQDYAYGFSLTANFEKAMHLPGNDFVSERTGCVVQEHAY
jgi:hypothetical protein